MLIVLLSPGSSVAFTWKAKPCSDSEASSCWLHHGDLLVMDEACQDEYLHCTSPGLADRRLNIAYRWIRYHTLGCPLAAGVMGSLPTCAQSSPVLGPVSVVFPASGLVCGALVVLSSRTSCTSTGGTYLFPLSGVGTAGFGVCVSAPRDPGDSRPGQDGMNS